MGRDPESGSCADREKVLRWDWQFGGERFFETLAGRAEVSGLVERR